MFRSDDLNIEIINIFLINREKCEYNTPKRPFHILTKRIKGYTDMTFANQRFKLDTNQLFLFRQTQNTHAGHTTAR